ncbi:hypothetical protein PMAYCL1PPCAC_08144 [Pristionchus mayeri]|uniref:Uncharacterized protein n=1 Tax=Pristionchus mayeri TaxID=1317129 RepID=A0AAN4ZE99_9BILA|nr:hypothetical protein PMAYCL1PPCAC_08144 [Pristionchus mayeri]
MPADISSPTLPPEIQTRIVRLAEESLKIMRLISRSWNSSVLAYLSDRRYQSSLERVYIVNADDVDFDDVDEDDNEEFDESGTWKHLRMWAIIPEDYAAARIGLGDWLSVHERFTGAVEVTCTQQGLYRAYLDDESEAANKKKDHASNRRFIRFFSMFSHIETLVLPGLWANKCALDTMQKMHISTLELHSSIDEDDKNKIVDYVRVHRIRRVLIACYSFEARNFNKFVIEIVKMGATIDIYGKGQTVKIFRRSRKFWEKKAEELKNEGISLKILHVMDTDLVAPYLYVKTHLSVRSNESDESDGERVKEKRGYNSTY